MATAVKLFDTIAAFEAHVGHPECNFAHFDFGAA
jgi:hypothetical protein